MEISFSIILPVRNGGNYAKECIDSVLQQTYSHFEFIILDNNSSDGTSEFIRSINDKRITHLRCDEDLSMPDNWKRALNVSTNEFITFIGHDDLLYANYLDVMSRMIAQYPDASLYQTHFNFIDPAGSIVRACKPMPEKLSAANYLRGEFLQSFDSMGTGFMFRAADFKKLGGYDASMPNLLFADYKLYTELSALSYQVIAAETCFAYRLHDSLSITTNVDLYTQAFEKYLMFISDLQKEHPGIQQVVQSAGPTFLLDYCRSLSHRLVKSPTDKRIRVGNFVRRCKELAVSLNIGKKFTPFSSDMTILFSSLIDSNSITRNTYRAIRRKYTSSKK